MTHAQNVSRPHYDAIIVGARCAGAATALMLARAGANVLVIDRQDYGSDTMSTHALMRTAVLQLRRWGLLDAVMAAGTPEVRTTTFHYGNEPLHIVLKAEHGVDHLCAPRRTVLDRILVDAARAAGAEIYHGMQLTNLACDADGRVVGAWLKNSAGATSFVRCDTLIGADGKDSLVAKLVHSATLLESETFAGCVYGYYENIDREGYHWHFGTNVAASVIPTNASQHCVAVNVPAAAFTSTFRGNVEGGFFRVLAANSPELAAEIRRARPASRLRGFAGLRGYLRQTHGPGWALVGDAGYFKDPLTAHGITDALRDATLLVKAIRDGQLSAYQEQRDALSKPLFDVTDAITSFRWDLDTVKTLHTKLSAAMRAETDHIASLSDHTSAEEYA
jgi:2-polyprenyl-6-methoxyphenol hydroxylase-like FAD-dependent oxidoreductase